MNNTIYIKHLIQKLNDHKKNAISQHGKCDLETADFLDDTEKWYQAIITYIKDHPPKNNVKALNINMGEKHTIDSINYIYCEASEDPNYVYINMYYQ